MQKEDRFSAQWENLGLDSLALFYAFLSHCPNSEETRYARQVVGECAFISWRKLPKGFSNLFSKKMLEIWRCSPKGDLSRLGGKHFQLLARLTSPEFAAKFLKIFLNKSYSEIQTISLEELEASLSARLKKYSSPSSRVPIP